MTQESKNQQAAQFLLEEHRARRVYQPLPDRISPRSVEEAYGMQEAFHALITGERGPIAGYKIALTTPVMQQLN